MLVEKRYSKKLERILEGLSVPLRIVDAQGMSLIPEDGTQVELPSVVVAPGINHHVGDLFFRALDMYPAMVILCPDAYPGAQDLLVMTDAMVMNLFKSSLSIGGPSDVYRGVLKQELSGTDLITRANENQIALELDRCVLLFQIEQIEKNSAYSILGELIPLTDTDALVEIDRHMVALVKDMENMDGFAELYQFAQAAQETLMEEAVKTAKVGIGEVKHTLAQLGESYLEAKKAMEVGRIFSGEESIHIFRRLMLERFLMNVNREESMHYHSLLFNRKNAKLFNDEMLQTIEMFFRKDLNLSDTARQLFIHRNTLVYRLDKVQRQTGLDLRRFDDAVTFKILYELKKCGQEKPKDIY
ncbi:MAG: helix-turn-helix domain-containing protein [Candidatus Limiplasma sp.]|nr:helix-turn-helix domain-containing protein [Candidatus Limiplasma sp.]